MNATAIVSGETVQVTWERRGTKIQATIGDRVYALDASEEKGVLWLDWDRQSIEVSVAVNAEITAENTHYKVSIRGHELAVEIFDPRQYRKRRVRDSRPGSEGGAVEVRASMPGKIVRILTSEGASVDVHQGIVVMEAMKMQNEISSTIAGKIVKLAVAEGETVRSGALIAIVGPAVLK
jgi:biotin carboxyl carrier protein